jgi:hypothetical protein
MSTRSGTTESTQHTKLKNRDFGRSREMRRSGIRTWELCKIFLPVCSSKQEGLAKSSLHLVDLDDWRWIAQRRCNITELLDIEFKITAATLSVFSNEEPAICVSEQILLDNWLS